MKNKIQCTSCDHKGDLVFKPQKAFKPKTLGISVTLIDGAFSAKCPKCGEEYTSIPLMDQLLKVIARSLISKAGLLTGEEIRYLRKHLGLDLKQFSKLTTYDVASLSRIENNKTKVSPMFDRQVRFLVQANQEDRDYDLHDAILSDELLSLTRLRMIFEGKAWKLQLKAS